MEKDVKQKSNTKKKNSKKVESSPKKKTESHSKKKTESSSKVTKNVSSSKEKKKTSVVEEKTSPFKKVVQSMPFLYTVFFLLIALVVFLGIAIYKKQGEDVIRYDFQIPIMEVGQTYEFGIDLEAFVKNNEKEYVFKVVNYRNDSILEEDISYEIVIENTTSTIISMMRNDDDKDLIENQESTHLTDVIHKGEKEEIYYHVQIDNRDHVLENDLIKIKIQS